MSGPVKARLRRLRAPPAHVECRWPRNGQGVGEATVDAEREAHDAEAGGWAHAGVLVLAVTLSNSSLLPTHNGTTQAKRPPAAGGAIRTPSRPGPERSTRR